MTPAATAALGRFAPLAAETHALVAGLRNSVVLVQVGRGGHGSGVFWPSAALGRGEGLVITNAHVVGRRTRATVELADERVVPAAVVARDDGNDLAALHVTAAPGLPPPVLVGDARALRVGELIVAVGNPLGVRGTATLGIVSAAPGRATWMASSSGGLRDGLPSDRLQADVTLAPGNSGGPLADASGRVVGIAAMILSPGIALAVPSNVVERFVAALERAWPLVAPAQQQRRAA